jgi:hypothetical protein
VVILLAYALSRPDALATLGRLYDDVVYLSVGKSIADGHGYRSAQLVGTPVHAKFPPLLPAIYALGWRAFGTLATVATMAQWLNVVVSALAGAVLWYFARRELAIRPVFAALFVIVPILTDRAMFYFTGAASEPWMLLGWVVSLILAARLTRLHAAEQPATGTAIALGFVLALTVLARTQSIAIAGAMLIGVAASRAGWRVVVTATIAAALPLIAWSVWHGAMLARGPVSPLPDQVSYVAWIPLGSPVAFVRFAIAMSRISIPAYWASTADILVGWTSAKTLVLATAIIALELTGIGLAARRFPVLALSLAATLGVLVVWPYVQDRFLTPVLPVLGLAGAVAADRIVAWLPTPGRRVAVGAAVVMTVALLGENARNRWSSVRGSPSSPYAHAIDEMARWIERNTAPNDKIMMPWGGAAYLRTGRRTSIPNPEEPALGRSVLEQPNEFFATRLLADSVDTVIIWDRAPGRAAPLLRALGTRCPGLLSEAPPRTPADSSRYDVHYYRVRRDLPCLRAFAITSAARVP